MQNKRNRLIAGNWKMNNDIAAARELARALAQACGKSYDGVDVLVCPPTIDLTVVSELLGDSSIALGAQNCFWEEKGAFTGETSIPMIKSVGASYCLIGHSERRGYFGETDADENKKAAALIAAGVTPVLCCGESEEVREAGTHVSFVTAQIKAALEGIELDNANQLVIAYEPIWAIGTGKTATAEDAQEVCGAIRSTLVELYGAELADGIRILYGGSAKPANVASFLEKDDVDGVLVGGASLKAADFAAMVEKAAE